MGSSNSIFSNGIISEPCGFINIDLTENYCKDTRVASFLVMAASDTRYPNPFR